MAQNQDTYIAQLLVELKDEGALAKFKERVEDVGAEVESVSRKASEWKSVFSGADLSNPVRNLRRAIIQSDAAMDDLVQNSVSMQKAITQRYGAVTAEIQDVTAANVRMGNAAQKAGYKAQQSQIKTSQTSQNLLRIMQDAQFGMLGMANNIQALGESLGRQAGKQKSYFDVMKAGVKDLIAGPFAIPALITLLTVLPQIDYGEMVQGMKDFGMQVADVVGLLQEGRTELNDFAAAVRDLESPEDFEDIAKELSQLDGEQLEKAKENVKSQAEELRTALDLLRKRLEENREVREEGFAPEAARQYKGIQDAIDRVTFQLQGQEKVLRAINAEETKRENTVQRFSKIIGQDQARYLLGLTEEKEKTEDAKEEAEDYNRVLERRFNLRRRALQLEARPDNLQQQLNQTLLNFDERRADIQDEFADKRKDVREQAKEGLLSEQREQEKLNELRRRENVLLTELNQVQERTLELRRDERFAEFMERQMDRARTIMENQQDLVDNTINKFNKFTEKRLKDAREELQVQKSLIQLKQRQLQVEKELGQFDVSETVAPDAGGPQGADLEFQQQMLKRQKNLQKQRIDAQVDFLKRKRSLGFDLTEREIAVIENAEKRKAQIEKRYQDKRFQQQMEHYRKTAGMVESSPVGNAVSGLITDLGAMWQAHYEDKLNWQQKSMSERAVMIGQMGGQILGRMSSIAEKSFASWKSARKQDLKDEGKTAEERRKILKKEGKKRFAIMKAIKITEASVNTATGVTRALAELPPPASYAAAAATAAAGLFRVKQIASMSIGDRLGGTGGGSGGQSNVSTGSFKQLNPTRNARRVSGFGTNMQQNRNNNQQQNFDKIDQAADKIGSAAENMEVKYDDKTAEDITNRGSQRSKNLNK